MLHTHFTKLYTTEAVSTPLSLLAPSNLLPIPSYVLESISHDVTKDEIKEVVFSFKPTKAPGPDGFHPIFFQKF